MDPECPEASVGPSFPVSTPLIVHVPEKWKHLAGSDYKVGGSSDRRVGFVDLAPTLLSIAGKKPPAHMQGHAFMGKHEAPAQEYGYGFRGRMDERYDMVAAWSANAISTFATTCPTNSMVSTSGICS